MGVLGENHRTTASDMEEFEMKTSTEFDLIASPIPPGLSVIEASAGTGKTFSIAHLVPRLIHQGAATHLGHILLVTYTKDAARELAQRTREVLAALAREHGDDGGPGVQALKEALPGITETARRSLADVDRLQVSTIHAFCQRVLQSDDMLCGWPSMPEVAADMDALMEETLRDVWEELLGADETLSAIAANVGWDFNKDLAFAKMALGKSQATFVPEPLALDEALTHFRESRYGFDKPVLNELRSAWAAVPPKYRSNNFPSEQELESLSWMILEGNDGQFADAANQIRKAESWARRTGAEGKAAAALLASCKAVWMANEATSLPQILRWSFRCRCAQLLRERVPRALAASRQVTYDGLVEAVRAGLAGPQGQCLRDRLAERYRVAIVDESQDTDAQQFEIFQKIFSTPKHRLVLIGDPKQAIYGFREADVNTYLQARHHANGAAYHLTQTFRQPQPLVEGINAFFRRPGSFFREDLAFHPGKSGLPGDRVLSVHGRPVPGRVEAWIAPDTMAAEFSNQTKRETRIADAVASEVVRLLQSSAELVTLATDGTPQSSIPVRPGHFAVLVSSHKEADVVRAALTRRGVPAIRARTGDVMRSEEAAEILIVLKALAEPRQRRLRYAALATRLLGCDAAALRQLDQDPGKDEQILERFLSWRDICEQHGVAATLSRIVAETNAAERLARGPDGERRITNLRHLTELLGCASSNLARDFPRLLKWFSRQITSRISGPAADEREQRLETDAEAVQIITMHSAKGLEYHLVFCPFLSGPRMPKDVVHLSQYGKPPALVDLSLADESLEIVQREQMEDRLRLTYVAMTRAMTRLWICGGAVRGARSQPTALDWLLRKDGDTYDGAWSKADAASQQAVLNSLALSCTDSSVLIQSPFPQPTDTRWCRPVASDRAPLEPEPFPPIPPPWSLTSFSRLTGEKHSSGSSQSDAPPRDPGTFAAATGGALAGTAIHDWIQSWDFSEPDPDAVKNHFSRYRLDPDPSGTPFHTAALPMLCTLREAILPGLDVRVADACPHPESSEWHFQLPVADGFGPSAIAAAYARHGSEDYAASVAELPADALEGFLHGFIDRIVCFDGKWGVADWKTNRLETYSPTDVATCIRRSHYLLQAHLYLVALRRFIGPQTPLAGAWILFLRGIRPRTSDGVAFVAPSMALLDDLDALFLKPAKL